MQLSQKHGDSAILVNYREYSNFSISADQFLRSTPLGDLQKLRGREELLAIFDDCIEFSGESHCGGWEFLLGVADADLTRQHPWPYIPLIVQKYREDMIHNMNPTYMSAGMRYSLWFDDLNSLQTLLGVCCSAKKSTIPLGRLFLQVIQDGCVPGNELAVFRLLLAHGANIHFVEDGTVTPTSSAMEFSSTFFAWLNLVHAVYGYSEEFIEDELATGIFARRWTKETLFDLATFCNNFMGSEWSIWTINERQICHFCNHNMASKWSNWEIADRKLCHFCNKKALNDRNTHFLEPWWEELCHMLKERRSLDEFSYLTSRLEQGKGVKRDEEKGRKPEEEKDSSHVEGDAYNSERAANFDNGGKTSDGCGMTYGIRVQRRYTTGCYARNYSQSDGGELRFKIDSHFESLGGSWRNWYQPGEVLCDNCLAFAEGIFQMDDETQDAEITFMPGSFVS